jgi:surface polysaccharide O-acyltransferase-like enzyme
MNFTVKTRKSNIELLRIVLFLMVICIHVTSFGLVIEDTYTFWGFNYSYAMFMRISSNIAVNCFVLTTGYLLAQKDVNVKKYLTNIIAPFILYIPMYIYLYWSLGQHDLIVLIKDFCSGVGQFYHLWYIIVLCFFSFSIPYLNKLIAVISRKQHIILTIILIGYSSFSVSLNSFTGLGYFQILSGNRLILFTCLYIIGAYFSRYGLNFNKYYAISLYLLIVVSITCFGYMKQYKLTDLRIMDDYSNIIFILLSLLFFMFFLLLNFESKLINHIGQLTFGAYIIHVYYITTLQKYLPLNAMLKKPTYFLYDISFVLLVFAFSILTESVRHHFAKYCYKFLMKLTSYQVQIRKDKNMTK